MASNDRNTQSSDSQSGDSQTDDSQSASAQSTRSEEELDREASALIGDTAEDRNLSGSTTYVTLPDQQGDASQNQPARQGSSEKPAGRGESYGSSRGDTQR